MTDSLRKAKSDLIFWSGQLRNANAAVIECEAMIAASGRLGGLWWSMWLRYHSWSKDKILYNILTIRDFINHHGDYQ